MKVNFSGVQSRSYNHADRSDKVIDTITFLVSEIRKMVGKLVLDPVR